MGAPCEQNKHGGDFSLTTCILRKRKNGPFYYQAGLTDAECKNLVIIVPLEKVLSKKED